MTASLSQIQQLNQHSQQLLSCLQLEKQALDQQDYTALSTLAIDKQQFVDQLQHLHQQIQSTYASGTIDSAIANSNDRKLISLWDETQKTIRSCHQQNEVNGLLINRSSQINKDMLSILTGKKEASSTYNAQGSQTGSNSLLNDIQV